MTNPQSDVRIMPVSVTDLARGMATVCRRIDEQPKHAGPIRGMGHRAALVPVIHRRVVAAAVRSPTSSR